MTQQMQNLHLSQSKKHSAPSSPNAAKRLYRNLSEKLKGSHSSFDEAYFRTRTDRLSLRKTSVVITLCFYSCLCLIGAVVFEFGEILRCSTFTSEPAFTVLEVLRVWEGRTCACLCCELKLDCASFPLFFLISCPFFSLSFSFSNVSKKQQQNGSVTNGSMN